MRQLLRRLDFVAHSQRKLIKLLLQVVARQVQFSPSCFAELVLWVRVCIHLVLQHHPAVDKIRCREDMQERASVRLEPIEARLRRLRAVWVGLLDQAELRSECVEQLHRCLAVQLLQRGEK